MNLEIDKRYSTYSISIVLYLLHNSQNYNDLWVSRYPDTEMQAKNYYKDINCGCQPVLLQKYTKLRFDIDVMTVNFINKNPECIEFDSFCETHGGQDLRGNMFSIKNKESDFKNFMSTLKEKNARFDSFNTLTLEDKTLITFF